MDSSCLCENCAKQFVCSDHLKWHIEQVQLPPILINCDDCVIFKDVGVIKVNFDKDGNIACDKRGMFLGFNPFKEII